VGLPLIHSGISAKISIRRFLRSFFKTSLSSAQKGGKKIKFKDFFFFFLLRDLLKLFLREKNTKKNLS